MLGVFGAATCHAIKLAVLAAMQKGSSKCEMWCAAILVAQHTDVWVTVRRLGLILGHSLGTKSLSDTTVGCVWI